jgi:cytosine/adenosine deaminase-related metal-dependent hydrolase
MPARTMIKDGIVLSLDREVGDFDDADVLVEGERIVAVGPDLETPEGATVIDASRAIVMPGFVDTHRHTWQAQLRTIACDWTLGQYMTGLHSGLSGHFRPEDDEGLMGPDVTYVHCNAVGDDELAMVAESGGTASCSPDIELQMGHGWPATGRLLKAGIRPTISIDVCSSNGGHMFGAMRSLIGTQRGFDHSEAQDRGEPLDHVPLTCREVVEFATIDGARACGLDDRVGTLTPGKQADILLLSTDSYGMFPANNPYGAVVYNAHPGVVDTIVVAGKVVKQGGELLGPDRERVRRLAFESRDHIFEQARATPATADAAIGGTWMPHHS